MNKTITLLAATLLLSSCAHFGAEPYWIKTHEAITGPLKQTIHNNDMAELLCRGKPACYNREIDTLVLRTDIAKEDIDCFIGHEVTGKYSHRNGYSHIGDGSKDMESMIQWKLYRENCGDSLYF